MSLLTDKDIMKLRGKDIVIDPFDENGLTPVGYDFHIGEFVYSLDDCRLLRPVDGNYVLPPETTILILTREWLWVSKRIGGLFHSKVSLVSKGLSPIATTLDPNWFGPLLITIRNNNKVEYRIPENSAFVTLVMFKAATPTEKKPDKPSHRIDLIRDIFARQKPEKWTKTQLQEQVDSLIGKALPSFDPETQRRFQQLVDAAAKPKITKIVELTAAINLRRKLFENAESILLYVLIVLLLTAQFYWSHINFIFNNVPYDSTISAGQISGIIVVITYILATRSKRT